jgi:hypothetical protein
MYFDATKLFSLFILHYNREINDLIKRTHAFYKAIILLRLHIDIFALISAKIKMGKLSYTYSLNLKKYNIFSNLQNVR